jgi:serine phosphatase RsbU (regulator of sigma subunit)
LDIAVNINGGSDRLQFIAKAYASLGDYRQAYLYQVRHKAYRDSVNTAEVQQMSYEYAAQIDVTRAENEAKDLRLSKLDLQIQAALAITLITLAFFIFYYFRRRKQIRELRHAYDQLADTTTAKERIDSELRIARDIQMSMVPRTFPAFPDRRDIDLYAAIVPAKAVGGDLYDFFLQDDRLYFCVGDVSGKGIPASLTMAVAVNLFRTVAKEGFPPEVIATKLNDTMAANNESAVFVTMFIGIIDLKTGHLDYCNCGHNSPVYGERRMHTSQTVFQFLDVESNVPIGLWPDFTFVGGHLDNIRGSSLFVYTDGVNEAENRMQEQFGEKRMLRVLRESTQPFGERTPKTRSHFLIDEMKYALDAFVDGAEQSDDLTMLCVSIK